MACRALAGWLRSSLSRTLAGDAFGFQCRELGSSPAVATGFFAHVPQAPKDPILGISENFLADTNPDKMNLGVGAYRDDDGKPVVLDVVREAERRVGGSHFMEYLPIGGLKEFTQLSIGLAYGEDSPALKGGHIASVQSLSGTGACRLMAEIQQRFLPGSMTLTPKPTWSNHHNIWKDAGVKREDYRYYKPSTKGLDFEGMTEDLRAAPNGSLVLLHACAHNPTGVDPSVEEWKEISKLMKEKGHFPFFDMAYQGFASGDFDRDGQAIRMFVADGHKCALGQSFAKNMGMYGQRVGCFSIVCDSAEEAARVESQMKLVARPAYSNPPIHGALLASTILKDNDLKQQWFKEVKVMADRIMSMRTLLKKGLEDAGSKLPWNHVTDQIGMFCFSGMTPEQVDKLTAKYSIYMTRNGRISMAGVNTKNVGRLASAIHDVTSE